MISSENSCRSDILATRVGLEIPDDLHYEAWESAGLKLVRIADTSTWCLGDWLNFGVNKYIDRYRCALENVGLDYQTLRNYAWVARKFDISRRRDKLSFQHHAEVASMSFEDQDQWLDLAETNRWSRNELRRRIRGGSVTAAGSATAVMPRMAVTQQHLERWREAAALAETSLEDWLVSTLNDAAAEVLYADEPA